MIVRVVIGLFLCCLTAGVLHGQLNPLYSDLDRDHDIARLSVLYGDTIVLHGIRSYDRMRVAEMIGRISEDDQSEYDRGLIYGLQMQSSETAPEAVDLGSRKPLWSTFYKTKADFFAVDRPHVYLRLNPILNLQFQSSDAVDHSLWTNQRGLEFRMGVDDRFFFYTRVWETQSNFASYIDDFVDAKRAIPGQGFFKDFAGGFPDIEKGFDYLNADGGLGFRFSPHVQGFLGHGKHFIGSGIRSMMLGDFQDNYFFARFEVDVGFLSFRNIFGELTATSPLEGNGQSLLPQKFFAAHYLSFRVAPRVRVGLFESIVFQRGDGFELQYLNPLIFYRSVEQKLGSPDNILIGLDLEARIGRKSTLYSQFVLDELVVSELFGGDRWWGNKYAFQLGLKSYDVGKISGLDAQVEFNAARPFIYAHQDSLLSYSHAHQPLAHPLGSNFAEALIQVRYPVMERMVVQSWLSYVIRGLDEEEEVSLGGDILKPSGKRDSDFGHDWFQGSRDELLHMLVRGSYEWKPGLYLDASLRIRDSRLAGTETVFGLGLRWNASFDPRLF